MNLLWFSTFLNEVKTILIIKCSFICLYRLLILCKAVSLTTRFETWHITTLSTYHSWETTNYIWHCCWCDVYGQVMRSTSAEHSIILLEVPVITRYILQFVTLVLLKEEVNTELRKILLLLSSHPPPSSMNILSQCLGILLWMTIGGFRLSGDSWLPPKIKWKKHTNGCRINK